MKTNVRIYTDLELIQKVESLPTFKGWKKGVTDIWVRSNEDAFNEFDDKVYTFECSEDGVRPKFIGVCSGTTNAGEDGLLKFDTKYKLKGCAVLCANVIVYDSHVYGLHKKQYAAYVQSFKVGFPYTRDSNRNKKAENYGEVFTNRIGANCHKAGKASTQIGGWSIACLVRNVEDEYNKWLDFMNRRPLTVAILDEF